MSMFEDVGEFHQKFDLPTANPSQRCAFPAGDILAYRIKFLEEELQEYRDAVAVGDLAGALDALADLAWVALGTAHYYHAPLDLVWDEVKRANMSKVHARDLPAGEHKAWRGKGDIAKPAGWEPPAIAEIVGEYNRSVDEFLVTTFTPPAP